MKKKVRKYDRYKNALKGARASYTYKLKKGLIPQGMTKEEYTKLYMYKKEYKEYIKTRKQLSKGLLRKEMTEQEFMDFYEQAPDIQETQFGLGKRLAMDERIFSKDKLKNINKKYGWNLSNQMNNYDLGNYIKTLIDDGILESDEVDDFIY